MESDQIYENSSWVCPLPWRHLSVEPNGNVYSCCHTNEYAPLGNLKENTLDEIFNGQKNRQIKEAFLNGETPEQCKICIDAEKWGQISLREVSRRVYPKLDFNRPDLKFLSLRLGNQCNLSCRICNPGLSTAWYSDAKQLGIPFEEKTIAPFENEDQFNEFLVNIPKDLDILYFAGGEPFLIEYFYRVLDRLIELEQTNLHIMINTNFTISQFKGRNPFELLSQFEKVSLDLSIDGMGPLNDLMRNGSRWEDLEKRIQYVKQTYPQIDLFLNPTISKLNIFQLGEFLDYMTDSYFKAGNIRINPLLKPSYLNIKNISDHKKEKIRDDIKKLKKKMLLKNDLQELGSLFMQLDGLIKMLDEENEANEEKVFFDKIEKLDQLRNQNLKFLAPEIYN